MKIDIFRNPEPVKIPTVVVNIFTTAVDDDYEFEVSQQEANRIVDTFLHWEYIKVTEAWKTYYINPLNVVSIEVE